MERGISLGYNQYIEKEDKKENINIEKYKELENICDKKYEIVYIKDDKYEMWRDNIKKVQKVEGVLINLDKPFVGRFFIKKENGALEIIPMASVVGMREIL